MSNDEPIEIEGSSGQSTQHAGFNCPRCGQGFETSVDVTYITEPGDGNSVEVHCPKCDFDFVYTVTLRASLEDMNGDTLEVF
ncbi:MAG: hypothetical protein MJH10_10915 [Epibacterium sp.]|nr:hypothetical protein [Epibacterium sp.]NQX74056.1 hypothetical protein [Epibacterium sp.]